MPSPLTVVIGAFTSDCTCPSTLTIIPLTWIPDWLMVMLLSPTVSVIFSIAVMEMEPVLTLIVRSPPCTVKLSPLALMVVVRPFLIVLVWLSSTSMVYCLLTVWVRLFFTSRVWSLSTVVDWLFSTSTVMSFSAWR